MTVISAERRLRLATSARYLLKALGLKKSGQIAAARAEMAACLAESAKLEAAADGLDIEFPMAVHDAKIVARYRNLPAHEASPVVLAILGWAVAWAQRPVPRPIGLPWPNWKACGRGTTRWPARSRRWSPAPRPTSWPMSPFIPKRSTLRFPEQFYTPAYYPNALSVVDEGFGRVRELEGGTHSWTTARGVVCSGYRSAVDGSVQTYCVWCRLTSIRKPARLDVILHGAAAF